MTKVLFKEPWRVGSSEGLKGGGVPRTPRRAETKRACVIFLFRAVPKILS